MLRPSHTLISPVTPLHSSCIKRALPTLILERPRGTVYQNGRPLPHAVSLSATQADVYILQSTLGKVRACQNFVARTTVTDVWPGFDLFPVPVVDLQLLCQSARFRRIQGRGAVPRGAICHFKRRWADSYWSVLLCRTTSYINLRQNWLTWLSRRSIVVIHSVNKQHQTRPSSSSSTLAHVVNVHANPQILDLCDVCSGVQGEEGQCGGWQSKNKNGYCGRNKSH